MPLALSYDWWAHVEVEGVGSRRKPLHQLQATPLPGSVWPGDYSAFVSQLPSFKVEWWQIDCMHLLWFLEQSAVNQMLQQQKCVCLHSGGQNSADRVLPRLASPEDPEGQSVLGRPPRLRWFSDNLCVPWLTLGQPRSLSFSVTSFWLTRFLHHSACPCVHMALSLCAYLCPNFPFL